jgi:hypothetical protein
MNVYGRASADQGVGAHRSNAMKTKLLAGVAIAATLAFVPTAWADITIGLVAPLVLVWSYRRPHRPASMRALIRTVVNDPVRF